jgi:hypothetical protein
VTFDRNELFAFEQDVCIGGSGKVKRPVPGRRREAMAAYFTLCDPTLERAHANILLNSNDRFLQLSSNVKNGIYNSLNKKSSTQSNRSQHQQFMYPTPPGIYAPSNLSSLTQRSTPPQP